jgi:hypothetical protein
MQDQRVGGARPFGGRHRRAQLLLDDLRIFGPGDADSVGDAEDVTVDRKPGHTQRMPQHDVRRLTSDPRQLHERSHRRRNLAMMVLDECARHAHE